MKLKMVKLAPLKPHPDNPNTHPPEQIEALGESLDKFKQTKNIVVWNDFIIAGHAVVESAIKSGLQTLEAEDISHWPEEDAVAYMLADIRLPAMAIVDDSQLVEALRHVEEPLDIPGFDDAYLAEVKEAEQLISGLTASLKGSPTSDRNFGDKKKQIKPVLYTDEIEILEKAIKLTGVKNRGQALVEVCRHYIDAKKGQLDLQIESVIAETGVEIFV